MGRDDETVTRVLVVEDNPADAQLVHLMLDQTGDYQSLTVDRVQAALEVLKRDEPDVVLLDLGLPDAQGLEAVDRITSDSGEAPLVVLTGVDDEDLALEALQHGAQDYLTKNDLTPRMLHRVLRYAIERQRLVGELRQARERVETQARLDPLTNLLNRRGLEYELRREGLRSHRDGHTLQVVAWDLDDFKAVNDALGHAAGDQVLAEVARRAEQVFRGTDLVARIGGDEFLAVLPGTRSAEGAVTADRLRTKIGAQAFHVDGAEVTITISVGLAEVDDERTPLESLLRAVDGELYRSKRSGKNRLSLAREGASSRTAADLARARIVPRAEPLLALEDDTPQAFEILSRTSVPGLELPREFFLACRDQACLVEADLNCLDVCVGASTWIDPVLTCHVNVHPQTLLEVGAAEVVSRLRRSDRRFVVDLSEQQIVGDPTDLLPMTREISQAGFRLGIDHIGALRSSLEALLVLEPDVVKIDLRWTRDLDGEQGRQRDLAKLLRLLRAAGSSIVLARPSDSADRAVVRRICESVGVNPLWSDPDRSIPLDGAPSDSIPVAATASRKTLEHP